MTTYDQKLTELAGRVATAEGRAAGLQEELDLARRTAAEELATANEQVAELENEVRRITRRAVSAEAERDELAETAPREGMDAGRHAARLYLSGARR